MRVDDNGLARLTDENFDTYLSTKPGLHFIKFYAPWYVDSGKWYTYYDLLTFFQVWTLPKTCSYLERISCPL